jgi:signal transduction histidine kinase
MLDSNAEIREWIGASIDITDQQRAEDQLHQTLNDLEARVAARTAELTEMNRQLVIEVEERRSAERARLQAVKRLVDAEEAERGKFSRELHDHVGQQLTTLSLGQRALRGSLDERGKIALDALQRDVEAITKGIHDLSLELRPCALDTAGLLAAIRSHLDEWTHRTGVMADFHSAALTSGLPDAVETTVYRIIQESLNNVAKHAHASRVSVILEKREAVLALIIEDDGVGFEAEATLARESKRLGLTGMIERASFFGGKVDIESSPGQGTRIFCHLPVPTNELGAAVGSANAK